MQLKIIIQPNNKYIFVSEFITSTPLFLFIILMQKIQIQIIYVL